MTIPPWQLIAWSPLPMTLHEFRRVVARMRPVASEGEAGASGRAAGLVERRGLALWAATRGGQPVGLAWEWAEVRDGAVALCDPMNVLSNVRLVDAAGGLLPAGERMVHLNSAVHGLDWQPRVGPGAACQPLAA